MFNILSDTPQLFSPTWCNSFRKESQCDKGSGARFSNLPNSIEDFLSSEYKWGTKEEMFLLLCSVHASFLNKFYSVLLLKTNKQTMVNKPINGTRNIFLQLTAMTSQVFLGSSWIHKNVWENRSNAKQIGTSLFIIKKTLGKYEQEFQNVSKCENIKDFLSQQVNWYFDPFEQLNNKMDEPALFLPWCY